MSGNGISWAICKSAPRSRQITTQAPHHSVFTGRMPFLPPNQQLKPPKASTLRGEINSKVIERPGVHAFHRVWNQFPASLRQPRTNLPDSNPPVPVTTTTSSIDSPLSSFITPSLFHSSLKPPFSATPSLCSLPFLLQYLLPGLPGLTDTAEYILFSHFFSFCSRIARGT